MGEKGRARERPWTPSLREGLRDRADLPGVASHERVMCSTRVLHSFLRLWLRLRRSSQERREGCSRSSPLPAPFGPGHPESTWPCPARHTPHLRPQGQAFDYSPPLSSAPHSPCPASQASARAGPTFWNTLFPLFSLNLGSCLPWLPPATVLWAPLSFWASLKDELTESRDLLPCSGLHPRTGPWPRRRSRGCATS